MQRVVGVQVAALRSAQRDPIKARHSTFKVQNLDARADKVTQRRIMT